MLPSLALVDTFEEYGATASIKWPNDVVVNGKKVAGTLVESAMRGEDVQYTVLGVDVSLDVVGRNAFAAAFLNRLEEWLELWKVRGAEAVRSAWGRRSTLDSGEVRPLSDAVQVR